MASWRFLLPIISGLLLAALPGLSAAQSGNPWAPAPPEPPPWDALGDNSWNQQQTPNYGGYGTQTLPNTQGGFSAGVQGGYSGQTYPRYQQPQIQQPQYQQPQYQQPQYQQPQVQQPQVQQPQYQQPQVQQPQVQQQNQLQPQRRTQQYRPRGDYAPLNGDPTEQPRQQQNRYRAAPQQPRQQQYGYGTGYAPYGGYGGNPYQGGLGGLYGNPGGYGLGGIGPFGGLGGLY